MFHFYDLSAIKRLLTISLLSPSCSWRDFDRSMFWLAAIGGSLILLHALLILILKFKKKKSETKSGYGALTFPRFEIFLVILALPSVCKASAALVTGTITLCF